MTITTLTISGTNYISYASIVEASRRLAVDPPRSGAWAALLGAAQKGINLVAATNRLDLLSWRGEKTGGAAQENAWPRTGLTYPDGTSVSTTEVPKEVENATALLAGSIVLKAGAADAGTSGSNTKRVKAGSAEVEFFRQQAGKPLQDETAFKLVQIFLEAASTSGALGPLASGTDGSSTFTDIDQWGRNRGFP